MLQHLSFCTCREGQISHEEITSYFMRGMSVCAKLGYNFNDAHNFHEITYKRPTFCDTCGGFVSPNHSGEDLTPPPGFSLTFDIFFLPAVGRH